MLRTWLTDSLDVQVPVIGAPMAGISDARLAVAVSAAGGLGMIGVGSSRPPSWIREQAVLAGAGATSSLTSGEPAPYGIGLMAWALERDDAQLTAVLELRPRLVSISFGDVEPHVRRVADAGIAVTAQAGTVEEALHAEQAGVDFVVVRGAEAGGHGRNELATMPLLQAVLDRVGVPVVAAGGIATARGLAAVLAAGAVGAWVGTALLTAHEATNSHAARARLIAAEHHQTVYGRVFDIAQHLGWPPEYGGRSLRNSYVDRWHDRLDELAHDDDATRQLAAARDTEDYDIAYLYAGQGVGSLLREQPAAEVIADLARAEYLLHDVAGGTARSINTESRGDQRSPLSTTSVHQDRPTG
ncbi:MAG: NAD(P)H-dependent flavin oxidoreductase [Propionibacteriaceae bacterium]